MFYFFSLKLEEMKTLQKLRKRQNGVSIVSLALGKRVTTEDEALVVRKGIVRFEVFTVVNIWIVVLWIMTVMFLIGGYMASKSKRPQSKFKKSCSDV
jgi:hypothetical protein